MTVAPHTVTLSNAPCGCAQTAASPRRNANSRSSTTTTGPSWLVCSWVLDSETEVMACATSNNPAVNEAPHTVSCLVTRRKIPYHVRTPKSPSLLVLPARLVVNRLNGSTTSEPKDSRKERETFRNWAPTALTPGAIWECACERGRVLHLHKFLRACRGDRTRSLHNHPHPASAAEKWRPERHANVNARTRAHAHTQTSAPEPYVHSSPSVHRGSTRQRSRGI